MAHAPLMPGKSVLVTGGTGGIGKTTAIGLAALDAGVGITGRDPRPTEAAAASIRAAPAVTSRGQLPRQWSARPGVAAALPPERNLRACRRRHESAVPAVF